MSFHNDGRFVVCLILCQTLTAFAETTSVTMRTWLALVADERIEVYTDPSGDDYRQMKQFGRGEPAQSETLPNLTVGVANLLG
jgi:hypothetical protein